jgi:ATP-dependent DNA helicase RecG
VSPGGLPNGLTTDDLEKGRSEIRNRTIARVFKTLGYIEQWGSGIQRIYDLCNLANVKRPVISESGDFVDWEFKRSDMTSKTGGATGGAIGGATGGAIKDTGGSTGGQIDLTERQTEILELIRVNNKISLRTIAKILNINESAIIKHLNKLKEKGALKRIGGTRGYWEVIEK